MRRLALLRSPAPLTLALALSGMLRAGEVPAADPAPMAEQLEYFEKHVRPLLAERCAKCHGAEGGKVKGGLRLDSRAAMLAGGDSGPAVVPGDPEESLLVEAIRYADPLLQMPPDGKLDRREVDILERWVRMGAPAPDAGEAPPARAGSWTLSDEDRDWWSFRPVADPAPPAVRGEAWVRDPIDRFILARLEAEGLSPAPEADRRALLRRLTFDLTGLPPTPEEMDAFLADGSADAYETVVERLLASPHYGERWGRHWLDVVRYADTSGCNGDFPMPEAYRYRNYVIESLNADKPYDRFLREQIAGDLLPAASEAQRREQLIATGYLAISRRFSSVAEEFHLTLDDTLDNLGKAVLGLSLSCARCHDHKFDPIPQSDYFALYGIFASSRFAFPGTEIYRHTRDLVPLVAPDELAALRPALDRMAAIDAEIFEVYEAIEEADTGPVKDGLRGRWEKLKAERDEIIKKLPAVDRAYAATEGEPADARLQLKGDPASLGPEVPRGFLQVLGGQVVPPDEPGSGRTQLADWLADPANPLTARVMVNRAWLHHFGKGLVRSPNDFGTRGDPPTHPELLDHLASRFVAGGWRLKDLHRAIVRSSIYRMASVENPEVARRDPDNRLLWTFNRRRLDAEEIRDAMLAVAGNLDPTMGGPHPFPPEWEWRYTQHKPFVDDYPNLRRSVYLMQQRIRLQPFLGTFDGADTNAPTDQRRPSTTPQQALFLLNSEFMHDQAARFADRLAAETDSAPGRVELAYQLALGRPPSADEVADALSYLEALAGPLEAAGLPAEGRDRAAWASYLRVLLSSNEFAFVD